VKVMRRVGSDMKPHRFRVPPPGNLTAVLLAVARCRCLAVIWLGVGIVRQDRALEIQRLDERRKVRRSFSSPHSNGPSRLKNACSSVRERPSNDLPPVALGRGDRSGVQAWPNGASSTTLPVPAMREGPADLYRVAETLEYANRDYERAIALLRRLSTSRDAE